MIPTFSTHFRVASTTAALCLAVAARASAQAPQGLAMQAPASSGRTDVAQEGFQPVALAPAEDNDITSLKISAGGFVSRGNARTIAATAALDYLMRRDRNQFSVLAAANYGRAAADADSPSVPTVENYQGRVRYDYFLAGGLAAFASVSARRDRFQGLDLRLNIDPGAAYYFIDDKAHRFWGELGYDLQYDVRRQEYIDAAALEDPTAEPIEDTEVRHNVRLFVGYDNQVTDAVKFNGGLEYLQNLKESETLRVNLDLGLTSQLSTTFSVATTVAVRFENDPLPGVEETDVITALNLVYSITE